MNKYMVQMHTLLCWLSGSHAANISVNKNAIAIFFFYAYTLKKRASLFHWGALTGSM